MSGVERELKLGVWPEFALPDLGRALRGGSMGEPDEQHLDAVYYDTRDLRLLRRGVTLRHRTGEDGGAVWTLKLPGAAASLGLARREVTVEADARAVPEHLTDLARGWALGARLHAVARMQTTRRSVAVSDRRGTTVASIDDDEVVVLRGRKVAARFRELEVELATDAPADILARLERPLRAAGAQPVPQMPKLTHALRPESTEPWALAAVELPRRPTVGEVISQRLTDRVGALVDAHAALVLDEDPSAIRTVRGMLRELAGELATFSTFLDAVVVDALQAELRWLGSRLAVPAGLDLAHARASAADSRPVELLDALQGERGPAGEALRRALRYARYGALLTGLAACASDPPVTGERHRRRWSAAVARELARASREGLRDAIGDLRADEDRAARASAAAYRLAAAVRLCEQDGGAPVKRAARDVAALTASLDHHDEARDAVAALHHLGTHLDNPRAAYAAGVLAGGEEALRDARRAAIEAAAAKLDRKGRWGWLA